MDEDEDNWEFFMQEQAALFKEPNANAIPERSREPTVNSNWAHLDEDEDDWTLPTQWIADEDVYRGNHHTLENGDGGSLGSKAGASPFRSASSEVCYSAGYSGLEFSGYVDKESRKDVQGSNVGTLTSNHSSSEFDYGACYTGPSCPLVLHHFTEVEQTYRYEEQRRDEDEAYQIQMQQLWDDHADDIELLKEPPTIHPRDEDLHDEDMYKVFSDIYPALPSYEAHGRMHIINWKTLVGPDHMGPEPDDEGKFLLHFVKSRLCDAVATILFESDPAAIDAWLDPSKKVMEWWHSPRCLHRGVMKTIFRRDGTDVIVGTFTDLGFNVCWSQHIKIVIDDDGKWNETFAFKSGQFQKKLGEKEPGASSRKIRGEIDWELFEIEEPKYHDEDELWDPVEALWHGRMLAHILLRNILNNYSQCRGRNTVELFVEGVLTAIEQRGTERVPRFNGIEHDRIEEVVSSPGVFARIEEDTKSSGSSFEVLVDDVGL